MIGLKPPATATKGKSTSTIKKSNPVIEVDDSDESSSLSSLQSNDKSNGSDDEDDEDEDEYDVAQMTDREARQMFNDKVLFFHSSYCLRSEIICPSYLRLQTMMQLCCLTMITTSKLPIPTRVAAGGGLARKPRNPPHQNPKECLMTQAIQVKRRLTRTTTPLDMFPCLLEVLSGRSLAR